MEGRADGIGLHLLQLGGDDGGQHGAAGLLQELGQAALLSRLDFREVHQPSSRASQRCRI